MKIILKILDSIKFSQFSVCFKQRRVGSSINLRTVVISVRAIGSWVKGHDKTAPHGRP